MRIVVALTLTLVAACETETPSGSSPATPTQTTVTTTVAPPTTTTPPTGSANRPPDARVTGDDGCHPVRRVDTVTPCEVRLTVDADDPDGDALRYQWSGCATGTGARATCTVDRLGELTATVEVTDGRGGRAEVSRIVEGRNRAPVPGSFACFYRRGQNPGAPDCGSEACPPPIPTLGIGYCIDGNFPAIDAEGDSMGCGPVVASGACSGVIGIYECGGVADAFSFEFRTGSREGDCVLQVSVSDSWGATGSTELRVPVGNLPLVYAAGMQEMGSVFNSLTLLSRNVTK